MNSFGVIFVHAMNVFESYENILKQNTLQKKLKKKGFSYEVIGPKRECLPLLVTLD